MTKYTKHTTDWGTYVDVKVNASEVLQKQIPKLSRGIISLSTVTDPYQAPEKKYGITREILIRLAEHDFPVSILTKSDLVLRDIDILKRFPRQQLEVGFSISTMDEYIRKHFEPQAPLLQKRIQALKTLHDNAIRTWVFIAPILPDITESSLLNLLNEIKSSVDYVLVDKLNIKCGNWRSISRILDHYYPSLLPRWKDTLFTPEKRIHHYQNICNTIEAFCTKNRLDVKFC